MALTVTFVWVPALTPEFANVAEMLAGAVPLNAEAVPVTSPVRLMSRPVANAVAVAALPSTEPEIVEVKVLTPPTVCALVLSTNAPEPPRLNTLVPSPM